MQDNELRQVLQYFVPVLCVVGILSSLVVMVDRPGLGWLLTAIGIAVTGAGLAGVIRVSPMVGAGQSAEGANAWERLAAGFASLALVGSGLFRAAGWLYALCLVGALFLGAYAVLGGSSWRALGMAVPRLLGAGFAGLPWAVHRLAAGQARPIRRFLGSGVIGLVLLLVFGTLLGSAEPAFGDMLADALPRWRPSRVFWAAVVAIMAVVLALAPAYLRANRTDRSMNPPTEPEERVTWTGLEWVVPVVLLDALFAAYLWVKLPLLFGGHPLVLDRGGPTYAEYARGGFIQLALVTVLALAVAGVAIAAAPRATRRDRTLLRVLVGALCTFSLVIVASAMQRMHIYGEAFGYTRPRILAAAAQLWLGGVFVLVTVVGLRLRPGPRAGWFPRLAVALAVAVLMGLVVLNPDRYIAQTVIGRYHHDGHLDAPYLASLSADALPALEMLPDPKRSCIMRQIVRRYPPDEPWYSYNASRAAAVQRAVQVPSWFNCDHYLAYGYRLEGNWIDPSELYR